MMNTLKNKILTKFPGFYNLLKTGYYFGLKFFTGKQRHEIVFNKIHKTNYWLDNESVSGSGSNLKNTETIRKELPLLLKEINIITMLDIPCGDFYWMKNVDLNRIMYIGADIVEILIKKNNSAYGNNKRKFIRCDLLKDDLPKADLIFCRDCLPHFSYNDINRALHQIKKSSAKWLLTSTYNKQTFNRDISTGLFRPLNLQIAPFNFPGPVKVIGDKCVTEKVILEDKVMALWRIEDIKTLKAVTRSNTEKH